MEDKRTVKPLSVVLMDAVLNKKSHLIKATYVIGIYADRATKHTVGKYFGEQDIDLSVINKETPRIEDVISHYPTIKWTDEYSTLVSFSGNNFEEQY